MDRIKKIRSLLFKWNREFNKRSFFWRREKLSYFQYVMVELLLQKTRAENAEKTIRIFLSKYRTPEDINEKNKNKIKKLIRGLGLQNQRFKVIYMIADYFKNNEKIDLKKIYGVGHYTSNAVRCFYLNQRVPVVDVNTSRIISRVFSIDNGIDLRKNSALLEKAKELLPTRNYRKFNWILLDFGALVCKQKPLCQECPIKEYCDYYKNSPSAQ